MKEITIGILITALAYFGWQLHKKSDWVTPQQVDEQISETTRVFSARIATERAISDSLRQVSIEAFERIREQNERINTLTTLSGRVRVVRDTVEVVRDVPVPTADTLIVFNQSFTDSLFLVRSELRFHNGGFNNMIHLEQLRDIRLDITLTESQGLVMTYVTSDDFELREYRTLQIQPKRERKISPITWGAIGFVTGIIFVLVLD